MLSPRSIDTNITGKGRRWRIAVGCGLLLALVVAWPLSERQRAKSALAKYERALRAKGERLTFNELVPPPPEGENKYPEFLGVLAALQSGPAVISNPPPTMKLIAPGKALAVTKELHWFIERGRRRVTWDQAEADLRTNAAALAQLRDVVRSPALRFGLRYRGLGTMLPHLAKYKATAQWLSASSLFNVHKGDIDAAIRDIEAIILLTGTVEHEPILVSQVVRTTFASMALDSVWHLLPSDKLDDQQLLRLHAILTAPDLIGPMIVALEGERVMSRDAIHSVRSAEIDMRNLFSGAVQLQGDDESASGLEKVIPYHDEVLGAVRSTIILPMWKFAWSYEDERHVLEEVQTMLEAARRVQSQRTASIMDEAVKALERKAGADGEFRSWRYLVTGMFIPGSSNSIRRICIVEASRELTITALALRRYHLRHGFFPKSLDELTPMFLATHPVDWMDGQKLRYRKEGASFVLWSVGEDGEDDGGAPNKTAPYVWTSDPDLVWPQPASREEVEKYYAENATSP